jgi:hypothetical protein
MIYLGIGQVIVCLVGRRKSSLGCVVVLLSTQLAELISDVILQSWVIPFSLRLEKQRNCISSGFPISSNPTFGDGDTYPMCSLLCIELNTPLAALT